MLRLVRRMEIRMIRVWFNHWFSTSYRLIELMKEDADKKICIIGSNMRKNSVIQKVVMNGTKSRPVKERSI